MGHIGHFAGWKKRLVVQWVKLQAENIQSDVDGTNLVAIFVAQLKHSGALLGSNPVRNKLCNMTANRKPHPWLRVRLCHYVLLDCLPMPRKTR